MSQRPHDVFFHHAHRNPQPGGDLLMAVTFDLVHDKGSPAGGRQFVERYCESGELLLLFDGGEGIVGRSQAVLYRAEVLLGLVPNFS